MSNKTLEMWSSQEVGRTLNGAVVYDPLSLECGQVWTDGDLATIWWTERPDEVITPTLLLSHLRRGLLKLT